MKKLGILILIIGSALFTRAQELDLAMLTDSLYKNNRELKALQFEIEMSSLRRSTTSYLGITSVNLQYGQINTKLQDLYYEADQEIRNPFSTTATRKSIELETTSLQIKFMRLKELKYSELKGFYIRGAYYHSLLNLLEREHAVFLAYLDQSELKLKVNEISEAEYALIKVQAAQISLQIQNAERAQHENDEMLRQLCGLTNQPIIKDYSDIEELAMNASYLTKPLSERFADEFSSVDEQKEQEVKASKLAYIPNLSAGYFNQTIEHDRGFQGVKFGLNFSILDGSNKQVSRQAQFERALNSEIGLQTITLLNNRLENTRHHYDMYRKLFDELNASNNSEESALDRYAEQGVELGELSSLEYVQLRQKRLDLLLIKLELQLQMALLNNELEYLTL